MPMKQPRWKSKVLWASVLAQIVSLLQLLGVFQKMGVDAGTVGNAIAIVLQIFVTFGVLNDPTISDHF